MGGEGFELAVENSDVSDNQPVAVPGKSDNTQIRAQILDALGRDLSRVVEAWDQLPGPLKAAILAIVNSSADRQEDAS
jgi:hypothetical protein